jgi:cyclohexyl-isocyanide hydratase
MESTRTLGIVLFPRFTGLDVVGPHEVLSRCPGYRCVFVAKTLTAVESDRRLRLLPDETFASCPPLDILLVPGGPGQSDVMDDAELLEFLTRQSRHAQWTVSVCTGSLLLAKAGALAGKRATTHWLAREELARLGAIAVADRVVWDGNLVSGAGVSAGIDLALAFVAAEHGVEAAQAIQLQIEYDPQPPFDVGAPEKAPPALVERLRQKSRFHGPKSG